MEIAGAVNEALAISSRLVVTAPPGAGKSTVLPLTILLGTAPFLPGNPRTALPGAETPHFAPGNPKTDSPGAEIPHFAPGNLKTDSPGADTPHFAPGNPKTDSPGAETPRFAPGGKILMLEPRRLAARQIAERMAYLLGEPVGRTVGYRIRFESRVSAATRIEVLTEGILTRMLVDDPALEGVDVVIFDEFHERSLQSDVALALVREAQQLLRPDLRIVLMSATIDTAALCRELDAPLLESAGRMFPVEVRHTPEEATAQDVAERVAHWVRTALREQAGDVLAFLPGEGEIRRCAELLGVLRQVQDDRPGQDDIKVYPLYGLLAPELQRAAIAPSPAGSRKVVLATPIAETSLTIEGVRVVVDGGFCRRLVFDPQSSLSRLETVRISRDMADQRCGRAGRVAPGVCYRLWSLATESRMAPTRVPEILKADLAGTLLDAGAWGESRLERLAWLTPPPAAHVAQARRLLELLGALDGAGRITPHGRALAALPCHPRIGQMLLAAEGSFGKLRMTDGLRMTEGAGTAGQPGTERSFGKLRMTDRLRMTEGLAADLAALLEEKDPLAALENDASITTRLEALAEARRSGRKGRWARIEQMAGQYRALADRARKQLAPKTGDSGATPRLEAGGGTEKGRNRTQPAQAGTANPYEAANPAGADNPYGATNPTGAADPYEAGALLARAYPERVAKASPGSPGRFLLATGEPAAVSPEDPLAACGWLAVASVSPRPGGVGRIFLAAPLDPEDVPELIRTRDRVAWDGKAAVAQRERRIGGLLVDARPLSEGVREQLTQAICEAAQKEGTAMLDFSDEVGNLQRRVGAVAAWHPELGLPDLSTEAVLKSAPAWLPPFVGRATTVAELKKIDLSEALWTLLSYEQQQAVERLAPSHIAVPTGSRIRVEYRQGAEAPVLRVRLQECFGLLDTPRVDDGRRPVLMELLSPGFKPVQLTSDLRSFWTGTYFEVRKELRRRYPRHAWPDDPLEAEAVRGVRRKQ